MSAADSAAGEFDPRFFEVFGCLGQLLSHVQEAVRAKAAGPGPGGPGGPWEQAFGREKFRRAWPGGRPVKPGGPRNGYQIMSEIEERSGGAWRPSPGAVYPALQQLADEGLIEAEESAGRRAFSLTDEGRRYVEENPEMA